MTRLAAHDVGTWRLVAQRVVPPLPGAAAVVEHLAAVQAQDLRAAATAVALRTPEGTTDGLAAALDAGTVVRSWPMRGTLHLLGAADLGWVLDLCAGRAETAMRRRRAELGISPADLDVARTTATGFLTREGASRAELLAAFEAAGQATAAGRGYHLIVHLALTGVLCQGPLRGREQLFVPVDGWVTDRRVPQDPLAEWTRRYLRGHGPATPADFAAWTKLALGQARRGFAAVREEFEAVLVDDVEHLVAPEVPDLVAAHRRAARSLHLLPGFDEFLLGYADRSHVLAPEHADRVAPGGNGVFRGTVVVGGTVAGTFTRDGTGLAHAPFAPFSAAQATALARRSATYPAGWFA
ncbi:winged helix DNA-binding domain-containing protein [Kineococcus rhizosphaerae]|uniref:winged helix DNA-binding domain-containing protein n=1 Tax=Kineococcus rhizosphaerae TaxID=559628 RepID=UPI001472CAB7|nr:winged helix DNA-binding domain-containing protein [Kineococcus rhizosphaerae]